MIIGFLIGLSIGAVVLYEYYKHVAVKKALDAIDRDTSMSLQGLYTHIANEVRELEQKIDLKKK